MLIGQGWCVCFCATSHFFAYADFFVCLADSKEIEGISKMNESELSENNERKSPQKTQKSASKENLG